MAKIAYPQALQKRSFKLSPLELLILGLIILGVLYLVTMWFQSFSAAGQLPGGSSVVPAELDAALEAADRLEAKLDTMEQQIVGMGRRIDDWEKSFKNSPSGQTLPALSGRITQLEKKIAKPEADKQLDERLNKVEKQLSQTSVSESRLDALDKRDQAQQQVLQNRLEKLEKDVSEPLKAQTRNETAMATLNRRLENLETIFDNKFLENQQAQSKISAHLEVLDKRLTNLQAAESSDKNQSAAPPPQDPGLDSRLDSLEKRLEQGEVGSSETKKMLNYLAGQLGELKRGVRIVSQRVTAQPPPAASTGSRPEQEVEYTPAPSAAPRIALPQPDESEGAVHTLRYRVRNGDTLYGIARKHQVKVSQIRDWNPKLKGRKYLYAKESLIIRLPDGQ